MNAKHTKKNLEISEIQEIINLAIPVDVEMVNIIIALSNLIGQFTWLLTEEDFPDYDD